MGTGGGSFWWPHREYNIIKKTDAALPLIYCLHCFFQITLSAGQRKGAVWSSMKSEGSTGTKSSEKKKRNWLLWYLGFLTFSSRVYLSLNLISLLIFSWNVISKISLLEFQATYSCIFFSLLGILSCVNKLHNHPSLHFTHVRRFSDTNVTELA